MIFDSVLCHSLEKKDGGAVDFLLKKLHGAKNVLAPQRFLLLGRQRRIAHRTGNRLPLKDAVEADHFSDTGDRRNLNNRNTDSLDTLRNRCTATRA